MKLNSSMFNNTNVWTERNYALPLFDRATVAEKTKSAPYWIHFGAGNIFRAFQANVVQTLLNE
jgi:fructuronate reductase